jgi:hypothetical protein
VRLVRKTIALGRLRSEDFELRGAHKWRASRAGAIPVHLVNTVREIRR